jgi:hypothetical protein
MFRNAIPVRVGVDLSIVFLWERRERGLISRENDTHSLSDTHVHTFWRFQSWNCKGVIWQGAAAVAGVCSLRFSTSEPSTLSNPAVGGGGGAAAAAAAGAPMLPPSVFRLFVSESKHQQTKSVCVWQERLKDDLNQTPEIVPTLEFQPKVSWSRTLQIRVCQCFSLSLSLHGNEIVVAVIRVVRVVWWWGNVTCIRRNFAMFIFAACPPLRALLWVSSISNFNSCFAVSWLR